MPVPFGGQSAAGPVEPTFGDRAVENRLFVIVMFAEPCSRGQYTVHPPPSSRFPVTVWFVPVPRLPIVIAELESSLAATVLRRIVTLDELLGIWMPSGCGSRLES